jgi:hypothetical protein
MPKRNKVDQADFRRDQIFRDQWDRPYHAPVEKETGDPCGPLSPRFTAPVYPPDAYIRIPGANVEPGRIHIDLERWEEDLQARHDEVDEELSRWAVTLYGAKAPEAIRRPPAELLSFVSNKERLLPVEIVQAMRAGNRWVLGLTHPESGLPYPMPEWARNLAYFQRQERKESSKRARKSQFPDVGEEYFEDPELVATGTAE